MWRVRLVKQNIKTTLGLVYGPVKDHHDATFYLGGSTCEPSYPTKVLQIRISICLNCDQVIGVVGWRAGEWRNCWGGFDVSALNGPGNPSPPRRHPTYPSDTGSVVGAGLISLPAYPHLHFRRIMFWQCFIEVHLFQATPDLSSEGS